MRNRDGAWEHGYRLRVRQQDRWRYPCRGVTSDQAENGMKETCQPGVMLVSR